MAAGRWLLAAGCWLLAAASEAMQPEGIMLQQLEAVRESLGGVFETEGLVRSNVFCSEHSEVLVAHYLEAEAREVKGETRGCTGWPRSLRLKQMRGWLKGLSLSLEAARKKWCIAEDKLEEHRERLTNEMALRALKDEERRKVFEARWAEVRGKMNRDA